MLKIACIADIHYGPDCKTKKGSEALKLLEGFKTYVETLKPDLTVELGDRISDVNKEEDLKNEQAVGEILRSLPGEVVCLSGNHDNACLTQKENEDALGISLGSKRIDLEGFHLVFWDTEPKLDFVRVFSLPDGPLAWLEKDLSTTTLPTIVFTHVPLNNGSMQGNHYFDPHAFPHHAYYPEEQGRAIRDVLEKSGVVVLCVNGHAHWNKQEKKNGIYYVTISSLTETAHTEGKPDGAFGKLCLDHTEDGVSITLNMRGKSACNMVMTLPDPPRGLLSRTAPVQTLTKS